MPEGETVDVGTLILYIEEGGAAGDGQTDAPSPEQAAAPTAQASATPAVTSEAQTTISTAVMTPVSLAEAGVKQRYSPAVMRLAQEHGIDLGRISGTGEGGRITRKDVQQVIDQGGQQPAPSTPVSHVEPTAQQSINDKVLSEPAPVKTVAVVNDIPVAA
ncbi:E3 binding domain-containing protein, partial [Frankia sp. Cpl3]|nr:E3 binding domain-containing protein [Frankia sp. Cpl3]